MPVVGQTDGMWMWDGSNWVCNPDCSQPAPCPPLGPPIFSGPAMQPPWYPGANGGVSFGALPPPNPVRGHQFWDGKTFWLFDGAAWVPIGGAVPSNGVSPGPGPSPGPVTTTTKVFQISVPTAGEPIGVSNAFSIVPFSLTPTVDILAAWDSTTHKFMPNKAGYYLFFIYQGLQIPETGASHALLWNDAGTYQALSQYYVTYGGAAAATFDLVVPSSGMVHMNGTTDFVRLWAGSSDGIFWGIGGQGVPTMICFLMP
jgi:hypothetical protein